MRFPAGVGVALLLLATAGCGHEKPFQPTPYSQDSARTGGSLRQLTYNLGADRAPAWLPGDSGLLYSAERLDTPSRHRCVASMGPRGGTIAALDCQNFALSIDSTYAFEWPAIRPGGEVSFLLVANRITSVRPGYQSFRLGQLGDLSSSIELFTLPYRVDTAFHTAVITPRWLDSARMIFIAGLLLVGEPPIPTDTVYGGRQVALLNRETGVSVITGIPGTTNASSVAVNPEDSIFYFTVMGDSRVYRSDLAGSNIQIHYDFGFTSVARDVAVRGDSLLVVVGTRAVMIDYPEVGAVQYDLGDRLRLIHPASGLDIVVGDSGLCYRRPAFAHTGQTLLAEGFATAGAASCTPTANASPEGNIWLLQLP